MNDREEEFLANAKKAKQHLDALMGKDVASRPPLHFRPSASGVSVTSLEPERPLLGTQRVSDLELRRIMDDPEAWLREIRERPQRGCLPERRLQAYLINRAYQHDRNIDAVAPALYDRDRTINIKFVTDEVSFPDESDTEKRVDLLAVRFGKGQCWPVIVELKAKRTLQDALGQLGAQARVFETHRPFLTELCKILIDRNVDLNESPIEKWLMWPKGPNAQDWTVEMKAHDVRVIEYEETDHGFRFDPVVATWPKERNEDHDGTV